MAGEELKKLVLHVGQVHRVAIELGLVGVGVEHQGTDANAAVIAHLAVSRQEVLEPHGEFGPVKGGHSEIVDHAFTQCELADLVSLNEQQHACGVFAVAAKLAAQCDGTVEVGGGIDDDPRYLVWYRALLRAQRHEFVADVVVELHNPMQVLGGEDGDGRQLEHPEIAVQLVLRDSRVVALPLGVFVADKPLGDVVAQYRSDDLRLLHL